MDNTKENKQLVAVYGSLLTGLSNHDVMIHAEGEYVGNGVINGFNLYPYAGMSYPCIAETDNNGQVHVEVYSVHNTGLVRLDMLEGYPNFYNRKQVTVHTENGNYHNVWVYYHETEPEGLEIIQHGDWKKYLERS